MLSDVIYYIQSRTGNNDRDFILREVNIAWREIWYGNDLPNSLQTCLIQPDFTYPLFALPSFIYEIRGLRLFNGQRLKLNFPTQYFHDEQWPQQSVWEWQPVGIRPNKLSIQDASQITVKIAKSQAAPLTVTLVGQTSMASKDRDTVTIPAGSLTATSEKQFLDFASITKDIITTVDVRLEDQNQNELAVIDAERNESRHILIQAGSDCPRCQLVPNCRCYKVLYKRPTDVWIYDEENIPNPWDLILQDKVVGAILSRTADRAAQGDKFSGKADEKIVRMDVVGQRGQDQAPDIRDSLAVRTYVGTFL